MLPMYRAFSLEELKEATNNFEQSAYIGEGSTGKVLTEIQNFNSCTEKKSHLCINRFHTSSIKTQEKTIRSESKCERTFGM